MIEILNELDRAMHQLHLARAGICPWCARDTAGLTDTDFADEEAWFEFLVSGVCESCQDIVFGNGGVSE